jgi:adenosylhomocysteine nucleosidase
VAADRPGVVAALPGEGRALVGRRLAAGSLVTLAGGGWLMLSGMGGGRAAAAATLLLERGATALLSWGSAGGLDPGLPAGSLLLPAAVRAADGATLAIDPAWHQRLCDRLAGHAALSTGVLMEGRGVIRRPADKAVLRETSGAVAVDMESAAVARVASRAGVPFVAVRAVADPASLAVPGAALAAVDGWGRLRLLPLLAALVRQPGQWRALRTLRTGFAASQATLAGVAARTGPQLLVR